MNMFVCDHFFHSLKTTNQIRQTPSHAIHARIHPYTHTSTHSVTRPTIHPSPHPSTSLQKHLLSSNRQSVHVYIHPPTYPSIHPFSIQSYTSIFSLQSYMNSVIY